jgi:hypothetical protein
VVKRVPEGQVDGLVNVVVKRQNLGSVEFEITAATASGRQLTNLAQML